MSIIDHSWILNRAKSFLGHNVTGALDFSDEDILACLDQETLPTLSIYLPWLTDIKVDLIRDQISNRNGIYQIQANNERLLGVNRVRDGVGAFGAFPYDPLMFGNILDRQLIADQQSATELSLTWDFRPPNILELFPKGLRYNEIYVECKCVHPTHLRTIPPTAREILKELFLSDLAIDVLSIRQYFQTMQTVYGEINLNIERLQAQADKRTEIIDKLELKQFKTAHARRIWIA
jgi:hypothetical protein